MKLLEQQNQGTENISKYLTALGGKAIDLE